MIANVGPANYKLPMEGVIVVEKKVKKDKKDITSRLQKEKEKFEKQKN